MPDPAVIRIATRGSALALAQAHMVLGQCWRQFPSRRFEIEIIHTTGDKKLAASLAHPDPSLPKGLFTKELEVALLEHRVDLAVHSLKDLPTDLPEGLCLGAVSARADVRDVLVYRDAARSGGASGAAVSEARLRGFGPRCGIEDLPAGAVVATSSTRRQAQLLQAHPGLRSVEIRGNVLTRLRKLAEQGSMDATILAAAGLQRLHYTITEEGRLEGEDVPAGLLATHLPPEVMLPCVGQAALGIEVRLNDERVEPICRGLNHHETFQCTAAERAFLQRMGGGCQSPVAAYATLEDRLLRLRAVSFRELPPRRAESRGALEDAVALGREVADQLR